MKKVFIEIEDFNEIVRYITTQSIPFSNASKAVKIAEILKKAKIAEVEEHLKEETK
jgi:hypothetical protein